MNIINSYRFGAGAFNGFGNASRSFDGGDWIEIDDGQIDGASVLTVSAWIKLDTLGLNQSIIGCRNGVGPAANDSAFRFIVRTTNQLDVLWGDGTGFFVSTLDGGTIPSGTWTHVAAVADSSGDCTRYINGTATGTVDDMSTYGVLDTNNNSGNFGIGARVASTTSKDLFLSGNIADVRIYNADIGASAIADLASGIDYQTNLVGWWLDDDDDVLDNAGTNDGTNNGSTYSTDGPAD